MTPFIDEFLEQLVKCREVTYDPMLRNKLCQVSPATIDRLLKEGKDRYRIKGRIHTKPGRLIKQEVEVRKGISWEKTSLVFWR